MGFISLLRDFETVGPLGTVGRLVGRLAGWEGGR